MRTNRKDNMVNERPGKDIAALNEIARAAMWSLEFEQLLDLATTRLADLPGVEEALLLVLESDPSGPFGVCVAGSLAVGSETDRTGSPDCCRIITSSPRGGLFEKPASCDSCC